MSDAFRDKRGKAIPPAAFENEPGPPRDPKMPADSLRAFDEKTARIKEAARARQQKRKRGG